MQRCTRWRSNLLFVFTSVSLENSKTAELLVKIQDGFAVRLQSIDKIRWSFFIAISHNKRMFIVGDPRLIRVNAWRDKRIEWWVIGPVFMKLQGRVLYRVEDVEAFENDSLRKSTSERATAALVVGGAA